MAPYVYGALGHERDIRLVSLSASTDDDPISVTVEHCSIDASADFVALSYVWGPQEPGTTMLCDGSELTIGSNLELLLRSLIKQGWSHKLYIDRISINQEDLEERGQQVALMGEIFSGASMVLVWLGSEIESTELAFQTVRSLAREALNAPLASGTSLPDVSSVPYPAFGDPTAQAIRELLAMEWFKRVWTFQEIVLSRNAILKCGEHHMPWSNLENLLVSLEYIGHTSTYESGFLRGAQDAAFEMTKARVYRRDPLLETNASARANVSLASLLHQLRQRNATDPRDKVYAVLSVATDVTPQDIVPDYNISHLDVYAATAKWLQRKYQSLGFLSLVEKKDRPELVSWVPDFRSKDDLNFLHQARVTFRPTQEIWRASGASIARPVTPSVPLHHLPVRGIRIGKVVARTDPPGNFMGNVAVGAAVLDGGTWQSFARTAADFDGRYPPTGEPIDVAFYRTRVWDALPEEGMNRRSRIQPPGVNDFPAFTPPPSARAMENLLRRTRDDVAGRVLNGTTRKRLVRSNTGYLGLARRCVELGDELWVLMGLDTPCVLRRVGPGRSGEDYYAWGGEAYVHGAMDGEVLLRVAGRRRADEAINGIGGEDQVWLDNLGSSGNQMSIPVTDLVLV